MPNIKVRILSTIGLMCKRGLNFLHLYCCAVFTLIHFSMDRKSICLVLLLQTAKSIILSVENIDLMKIDENTFDAIHMNHDQDSHLEDFKRISELYPIRSIEQDGFGHILKIMTMEELIKLTNDSSYPEFIKDPELSIFVICTDLKDFDDILQNVRIPGQPYIYAILQNQLWEIQIFSKKAIPVLKSNWLQRRLDFNGAKVKIVLDPKADPHNPISTSLLAKRFNLTLIEEKFEGYGYKEGSKWTGAVGQLLDNHIDVAPLLLSFTKERMEVIEVGYPLITSTENFYYSNNSIKITSWTALFQVFSKYSWILILSTLMFLIFLLTGVLAAIFQRELSLVSLAWSFVAIIKTFFANSVNLAIIKKADSSQGWLILISSISLLGAFIYWHFTGILVSMLAVPSQNKDLIKSFDDLLIKKNVKVKMYGGGLYLSFAKNWMKDDSKKQSAFEKSIAPYTYPDLTDIGEHLQDLIDRPDPNFSFLIDDFWIQHAIAMSEGNLKICQFTKSRAIDFPVISAGWMYPRNSLLKPIFDSFIHEIHEKGIYRRIVENPTQTCDENSFISVSLEFVFTLFIILFFGIFVSICLALLEKLGFSPFANFDLWP